MQCSEGYKKCKRYVINVYLYSKCVTDSSIGECMERKRTLEINNEKLKLA